MIRASSRSFRSFAECAELDQRSARARVNRSNIVDASTLETSPCARPRERPRTPQPCRGCSARSPASIASDTGIDRSSAMLLARRNAVGMGSLSISKSTSLALLPRCCEPARASPGRRPPRRRAWHRNWSAQPYEPGGIEAQGFVGTTQEVTLAQTSALQRRWSRAWDGDAGAGDRQRIGWAVASCSPLISGVVQRDNSRTRVLPRGREGPSCNPRDDQCPPFSLIDSEFFTDVTPETLFAAVPAFSTWDASGTCPASVIALPLTITLTPAVSTPLFDSALSTFLLTARFAFLTSDLDIPCDAADVADAVDVAAGSLLCDQAFKDAARINPLLANLSALIAFIAYSPSKVTASLYRIVELPRL